MINEIVNYKEFGRCLRLDNGKIEAYFTLDIGPRLIKFNCSGKENMLFNDITRCVDVSSLFGEGVKWHTYGGHRMWVSPEEMPKTYYPDCEKVELDVKEENGKVTATLTPPPQRINNLQHKWVVTIAENEDTLQLDHYLTNVGDEIVKKGIWGITVTDKDGIAVLKQPERKTALLPDRQIVFWPYTRMNDERIMLGERFIAVQQDPADTQVPAKIGYTNMEGKLYCFNYGQAMSISYTPDYENGEYPDFNVSTEVYTNKAILEIETLGHIGNILPGQTVSHKEIWHAVPCEFKPTLNEDEIEKAMEIAFG